MQICDRFSPSAGISSKVFSSIFSQHRKETIHVILVKRHSCGKLVHVILVERYSLKHLFPQYTRYTNILQQFDQELTYTYIMWSHIKQITSRA